MLRVAVDIGGTFTDLMVFDDADSSLRTSKALTTPRALADGVRTCLRGAGVRLNDVRVLIHGSTIVINALLERRGARTALVTTAGFRDVYEIGRINRPESFNLFFRKHVPLIPRDLRWECDERTDAEGGELRPVRPGEAEAIAERVRREGIEALAIVFLHAYANPGHEEELAAALRQLLPDVYISTSNRISREYREYERTSTTAANAYVGPVVRSYLGDLQGWLDAGGFGGDLAIMQSSGGLMDVSSAREQCIQMMESGPAGGVTGTQHLCQVLGVERAIAFDMGGTTAKACVIEGGSPLSATDYFVGGYNEGLPIRIPVIDIKEVGLGGGSIAWVESERFLRVGPRSAGADPGPACYGRGGEEPTVTDADVVLGAIDPRRFLGGELSLDADRAAAAIQRRIAVPLGLPLEAAAEGIQRVAAAQMAYAIRAVTVQRGLDPRDFILVAYGGGGPLHIGQVARELGIRRVVVPPWPGLFSAFGMLVADYRRDVVQTAIRRLRAEEMDFVEGRYRDLEAEARTEVEHLCPAGAVIVLQRSADMRYVGQEHSVTVPVPPDLLAAGAWEALKTTFDSVHEARYSHSAPEEPAEFVNLRVSATGSSTKPAVAQLAVGGSRPPLRETERPVRFPGLPEPVATGVYRRDSLLAGDEVRGPAVVEEATSATLLAPGDRLHVGPHGELHLEVAAG